MSAKGAPEHRATAAAPKKSFVVLLNGEPHRGPIEVGDAYVICCDGAYAWAKDRVRIDENLGDFDSLKERPYPAPLHTFPSEKDETDGELAIDRISDMGGTDVVIYGAGGGREDHLLGNVHLLYKAMLLGISAVIKNNASTLLLCGAGAHRLPCGAGRTVSLLPFGGDAHIMEMRGLKYAAGDLWLRYGSTRGISNLTTDEDGFSFRVREGCVLVVINEEVV